MLSLFCKKNEKAQIKSNVEPFGNVKVVLDDIHNQFDLAEN
jgi:hypothetical protein